jgi:hypothetical protein
MLRRFIFFISCLVTVGDTFSQSDLKGILNSDYRITAAYTSRYTFIDGFQRPVVSVKAGALFAERLALGLGYAQLKKPYEFVGVVPVTHSLFAETDIKFKFWYVYTYADYVFHRTKYWEFSLPICMGIGSSNYMYAVSDIEYKKSNGAVYIYEPSIAWHYKPVPWLGVGADVGYRIMRVKKEYWKHQFNSPVYAFKVMIFWRELYNTMKKKKIL